MKETEGERKITGRIVEKEAEREKGSEAPQIFPNTDRKMDRKSMMRRYGLMTQIGMRKKEGSEEETRQSRM